MAEREDDTNLSMGSNDISKPDSAERRRTAAAGTGTQTQIAALDAEKKKNVDSLENKPTGDVNDDELVIRKKDGKSDILDTDEGNS